LRDSASPRAAKSDAGGAGSRLVDTDVERVIDAWSTLLPAVRDGILAMIDASANANG